MTETAKAIYERLKVNREVYVTRAEECAKYTIPFLFPKEGDNGTTKYYTPFQAVGARGVNNLASKLLLALFPPNVPFFRLDIREDVAKYMESTPEDKQQVEQQLVQQEQIFQKYFESNQLRVTLHEAIKQLIVAGNCCLFLPPKEGGIRMYRLPNFVVQRDAMGNTIQLITVDRMSINTIPSDVLSLVYRYGTDLKEDETVEVYTRVTFDYENQTCNSYQEIEGVNIEGYEQSFPLNASPWIPLRLFKLDGEHYSRSYVEEYIGDLHTLEGLSKAIAEISAIAATVINLVNPNGVTQVRKVASCKNGGFVSGRGDDIQTLQLQKAQDMQIAKTTADAIEARLSYAFMLNSAVQRQGERVTAEEIRYVANELEDTLGGVYSILSLELQLPLVNVILNYLMRNGEIPELPSDIVRPAITTGVEAIGRGHDLTKLTTFMQLIGQIPEASSAVKWDSVCLAIASACNLDTTGLIKSPEEIMQEQQQTQMLAMAQQVLPNATKGVMDNINQQQQEQGG